MPELPDIELYLHALRPRLVGRPLDLVRLGSPFLVRSVDPPLTAVHGRRVLSVTRLGKRVVWSLEGDLFVIIHLMIAGRFKWSDRGAKMPGKIGLAAFDFDGGTLLLTEAGTQRRASLHVVRGAHELAAHDPGGIDVLTSTVEDFRAALTRENHTLKRALTDPHLLSGIGNAYSDEILHSARLSPTLLTAKLSVEQVTVLHAAAVKVLESWRDRLIRETGAGFPEKVTAFRDGMAVHGRYGQPCPDCGAPVQRIQYATNEANYCPTCQTGGKLLADRGLSRLLKDDWPKSLEELERRKDASRR